VERPASSSRLAPRGGGPTAPSWRAPPAGAAGAAGLGAKSALIERHRLGGECLWNGCVPSKALIAASKAAYSARTAGRFGVHTGPVTVNLDEALAHVRRVQDEIAPHDSPERFRGLGVHVVEGNATFLDRNTIEVNGSTLRARNIVIATGTSPAVPPIPGLADVTFHTNETIFAIPELPSTLLVIGGGPIGTELAQSFARLGSTVHIVEAMPSFFVREDAEIAALLQEQLEAEGIHIHLGAQVTQVRTADGKTQITLKHADGHESELAGDALLIAVGRRPNLDGLGLDAIGVKTDRGGVVTDAKLRTNVSGIFAAGDVVSGGLKFTHVADHMARGVLRNALFPGSSALSYSAVPWVTFTDPELARVGLTEAEARDRFGDSIGVWRREIGAVDRVITDGGPPGLVKIVTDHKGTVIGGHILSAHAGDMIGELTIAVKLGLTVGQLGAVIHPYPTTAEAIKQASEQRLKSTFTGWKRSLVKRLVNRV
jgi:pyruvate/2-oxoglutarate dehydrogenase complex dihydrolipoamide dehydrogenase (E3) component